MDTAGHGGLKLAAGVWARVMVQFPTQKRYAPDGWLEEDCDWALAALACPELFEPRDCWFALRAFGPGEYGQAVADWLKTSAAEPVKARAALHTEEKFTPEMLANTVNNQVQPELFA